ncbi:LigB family dioxygenase [Kingella potus]|uniref:LigB family dioxygenase n=1 Tax=Kingella potus TaxID=265175 RepID=A0A377QYX7_9NEIS|nr:class III extradiol ring-cleavage dioxygenase [Kingella potus]UOP00910.1 dioxygenase [Kingella potus]STR00566.1 LigB family dioxygenase [Kingella potus]
MKLPVLFVGNGSPLNAVRSTAHTEEWRNIGSEILDEYDGEIEAVLCVSPNWTTEGTRITASPNPPTLHGFSGFPPELSQVAYPAAGSPDTAARVCALLGADTVTPDPERGLDHGVWAVFKHLIPDASVPVVQLSLDRRLDAQGHYDLAARLAPLRKEGILIAATGNTVSNLPLHDWQNPDSTGNAYAWADLARELINKWVAARRLDRLLDEAHYPVAVRQALHLRQNFYPMLYPLATVGEKEPVEFFNDETVGKSVSMTSFVIGFL